MGGRRLRGPRRERAERLGFGERQLEALLEHRITREPEIDEGAAMQQLGGAEGLTQRASSFDRRDVIRAWCEQLPHGATVAEVEGLADRFLGSPWSVPLLDAQAAHSEREAGHEWAPRYSTPELLETEREATSSETCDSFAKRWPTDYPRPRASSNHYNSDRVKRFAEDFKGIRLGDVDRPTARAWAAQHPWNLGGVRAMFTDAVNDGLCELNPFANLRLPQSKGRKDIVVLTEPELHALADTALRVRQLGDFGREFRAMILFAGYVGLRPGELFAVQRSDVKGQLVRIERALSSHTQTVDLPKNGQARTVAIPPAAQEALQDLTPNPNGLLFATPRGKMWTQSGHHRYWDLVRTIAGRPEFEFYALRHTAATILLERGATPWDVAIQLGHTDGGQLVMELYGHPSEDAARARLLQAFDDTVEPLRAIRKTEAV